jgi:hypothetical protein
VTARTTDGVATAEGGGAGEFRVLGVVVVEQGLPGAAASKQGFRGDFAEKQGLVGLVEAHGLLGLVAEIEGRVDVVEPAEGFVRVVWANAQPKVSEKAAAAARIFCIFTPGTSGSSTRRGWQASQFALSMVTRTDRGHNNPGWLEGCIVG